MPKLFSFDRDGTVETGEPAGLIRLETLFRLCAEGHEVWIHGNQRLQRETDLPGIILAQRKIGIRDPKRACDIERRKRLEIIRQANPDMNEYIAIDDIDLTNTSYYTYYTPEKFAAKYQ